MKSVVRGDAFTSHVCVTLSRWNAARFQKVIPDAEAIAKGSRWTDSPFPSSNPGPAGSNGGRPLNGSPCCCKAAERGGYQGGVYQALSEAGLHPDWVAGISIGAFNAALIAGNPPERRVERLREFWEEVSERFPVPLDHDPSFQRWLNQARAFFILLLGAPNFFTPRWPSPVLLPPRDLKNLSFYDVAPLRATLERLVDFDRINARQMRFSVGAVNVRTGVLSYFDNENQRIDPGHVMASGSLPPGLPATEIDGEYYWDGGVVSNTPLQRVLDSKPRQDTLAFQIDLWSAAGELPRDFAQARRQGKGHSLRQPHQSHDGPI